MEPISPPPISHPPSSPSVFHNLRQFIIISVLVLPAIFFWTLLVLGGLGIYGLLTALDEEATCNVAQVPLHGVLTTTSSGYANILDFGYITAADDIVAQIHDAEVDDTVHAILIDIDSPGGTPVAGDEVAEALAQASKPTVAVIRDLGASAAYWAAAGADYIIASPVSDVGSIGVTMSYTELAGANEEEGSRWVGISSGTFKDAGNPERPLSDEEKAFFQAQVNQVHEYMVDRIAHFRPSLTREQYAIMADGKAYLGSEALNKGLIDALGGQQDALRHIDALSGYTSGESILCPPVGNMWDSFL